jgi:Ca2+-binding RTX toxin-like protein
VDNAGDRITETGTGGVDSVEAKVTHTLANFVENLTLSGTAGLGGTGNTLANKLTGNTGANVLNGLGGNDSLAGGGGNDGLNGGTGKDSLTGNAGADRFVFTSANDSTAAAFDVITDFVRGSDKIDLSKLDAIATRAGQQDFTFIGKSAFSANATGQLRIEMSGGKLMLFGSTDADAAAEFSVQIMGTTTLSAGDLAF